MCEGGLSPYENRLVRSLRRRSLLREFEAIFRSSNIATLASTRATLEIGGNGSSSNVSAMGTPFDNSCSFTALIAAFLSHLDNASTV